MGTDGHVCCVDDRSVHGIREVVVFVNIRKVRKNKGIKQSEIARDIGVRRDTYSNYERGITPIPSDKLIMISQILDESIDYLLEMSDLTRQGIDDIRKYVGNIQHLIEKGL